MKDRNRRESARRRDFMEWQHSRERDYGHDQPWREERRPRDPDEPYGAERARQFGGERQSQGQGWGRGYGYGFGDSGEYRDDQRGGRGWDDYAREGDRAREWNAGGSLGFGPEEGDWRDSDWAPNRPARGSGTWAGDWADARGNIGMAGYAGRGPKDYRRSDDRIREDVCDLLTDDPGVDASELSVTVESGEVTLMGSVATRDQKRRAEEDAERVSGVRDVINQIRVSRGETTTGTAPSQGREKTARGGATTQQGVAADRDRDR